MDDTINFADLEKAQATPAPLGGTINFADLEAQHAGEPQPSPTVNFADMEKNVVSQAPTYDAVQAIKGAASSFLTDTKNQLLNPLGLPQDQLDAANASPTHPVNVIKDAFGEAESGVGSALKKLMIPLNIETGAVIRAMDKTIAPGIQAATMPEGGIKPDVSFNDITDFMAQKYLGSPEDVMKWAISKGWSATNAARLSAVYQTIPALVGFGLNVELDPLSLISGGGLTKESLELRKSGVLGNEARNIIEAKIPLTGKSVALSAQDAAKAIQSIPGGKAALNAAGAFLDKAYDMVRGFDLRTGDPYLDLHTTTHAGLSRAAGSVLNEEFILPYHAKNFTEPERDLLTTLIERTPNIAPNVPEKVINAAGIKAGLEASQVEDKIRNMVEIQAAGHGVTLVPGREDALVAQAMAVKQLNAKILEKLHEAGELNESNAAQKIAENYLVHRADPTFVKHKDLELALSKQEAELSRAVKNTVRGTPLSSFDPTKFGRKMPYDLETVNGIMKEKHGIDAFFLKDPVYATGLKYLETEKFLRDKSILEYLAGAPYAREASDPVARAARFEPIRHPRFEGKTFVMADGSEHTFNRLVFPKEIARKATYYMIPREVGNLTAYLGAYHRVYRATSLFSPGYYARNMMDNMIKNYIQGVKVEDYLDSTRVLFGKRGALEVKTPNGIRKIPLEDVRRMAVNLGVPHGGQFKEGLTEALTVGKAMAKKGIVTKVEDLLSGLRHLGEKGENYTRMAMFTNRIRSGYTPEMAAHEVEKFLFDFGRNTQATDLVRLFPMPFVQHAVKTAFITPEMLGKGAVTYNTLHNKFMIALGRAFHDPVTQAEITELMPDWRKHQDVVAGPMLPNTWFQEVMNGDKLAPQLGKVALFRQSMGLDILNMFNIFDKQAMKSGENFGPLMQAFAGLALGRDIRLNQSIDVNPNNPNWPHRAAWALNRALESEFSFPNSYKFLKQKLGIGDPKYFTPDALLLLQGAFPQFGGFVNLDKEYLGRVMAFQAAYKDLRGKLTSAAIKEATGKDPSVALADAPGAFKSVYGAFRPDYSSVDVYKELMGEVSSVSKAQYAAGGLKGQYTIPQLAGLLKNLERTIQHNNEAYVVTKTRYLQMLKEERTPEGRARLIEQMKSGGQGPLN